jgi:hypothetical protein
MTPDRTVIETVFWEDDPARTRDVIGFCHVCYPPFLLRSDEPVMLVSPQGLAHHSSIDGETDCGHDATGPDWWWRS